MPISPNDQAAHKKKKKLTPLKSPQKKKNPKNEQIQDFS